MQNTKQRALIGTVIHAHAMSDLICATRLLLLLEMLLFGISSPLPFPLLRHCTLLLLPPVLAHFLCLKSRADL